MNLQNKCVCDNRGNGRRGSTTTFAEMSLAEGEIAQFKYCLQPHIIVRLFCASFHRSVEHNCIHKSPQSSKLSRMASWSYPTFTKRTYHTIVASRYYDTDDRGPDDASISRLQLPYTAWNLVDIVRTSHIRKRCTTGKYFTSYMLGTATFVRKAEA